MVALFSYSKYPGGHNIRISQWKTNKDLYENILYQADVQVIQKQRGGMVLF